MQGEKGSSDIKRDWIEYNELAVDIKEKRKAWKQRAWASYISLQEIGLHAKIIS